VIQSAPPFTLAGFRRGAAMAVPFGVSAVLYGVAFGALAIEATRQSIRHPSANGPA
jgi:predicted branched-subunit amino acid permease